MIQFSLPAFRFIMLWTDLLLFLLVAAAAAFLLYAARREYYRVAWRQLKVKPLPMICMGILALYLAVALTDSVRFQRRASAEDGNRLVTRQDEPAYDTEILTLLDLFCEPLRSHTEKTFSAPFATRQFTRENMELPDGRLVRGYPRLQYGGAHLDDPSRKSGDIAGLLFQGLLTGVGLGLVLLAGAAGLSVASDRLFSETPDSHASLRTGLKVGTFLALFGVLVALAATLSAKYHILGTDQVGQDVLYRSLKGCRVGLIIGTLTTLITTPLAILFGIMAGYFGGLLDDLIQYVYTTLYSIPSILLITAAMLIVQARVQEDQAIVASDTKLLWLCVVLGVVSWTGLCRLLRGETLKVRELEYVQAAEAFGVNRLTIMFRHILPNVMHIVLISVILNFSGLVLAEAVLAYVGIGVDPSMESWGNLINGARLDISRDPVVWWNLTAAFLFMFGLVLPANIFGDAIRDALDPKLKTE